MEMLLIGLILTLLLVLFVPLALAPLIIEYAGGIGASAGVLIGRTEYDDRDEPGTSNRLVRIPASPSEASEQAA